MTEFKIDKMDDDKKVKIVFKDDEDYKAIKGWILQEDNFFITLLAEVTSIEFRIGKAHIVLIRPASYDIDSNGGGQV